MRSDSNKGRKNASSTGRNVRSEVYCEVQCKGDHFLAICMTDSEATKKQTSNVSLQRHQIHTVDAHLTVVWFYDQMVQVHSVRISSVESCVTEILRILDIYKYKTDVNIIAT